MLLNILYFKWEVMFKKSFISFLNPKNTSLIGVLRKFSFSHKDFLDINSLKSIGLDKQKKRHVHIYI
jgi:hypothetical protein